jgi:mono/diheme cytochrome c family protein
MKNKMQDSSGQRSVYEIRDMRFDEFENTPFFKSLKLIYNFMRKVFTKLFSFIILLITFTSCQSEEKVKLEQYYIGGKEIYEKNCANCHQKDGKGLQNLYPPIAGSDFLKNKEQVILAIKSGISGEIVVNGKKYNQPMPANNQLQNLDIAEVVTYIYNEWGGEKTITETKFVEQVLIKK